ncbi:MAG: sulfide/dihydroorotate dehydrogenase-like FAD/NAD-binding protein, partial [Sarcina sp.]
MNYEKIECIDSGTEFCPCHLADKGECLLCSQLQGKCFCDCKNWKGICIYQEYINNKSKPKKLRDIFKVKILEKNFYEEKLMKLVVLAPHKLIMDLLNPGSYIFIKSDENNNYFDFPISIENSDPDNDTLTFYIEIRGVKTKNILNIKENENLLIRGPYFNGTFGIKNIDKTLNKKCLVLARGIGIAPSRPVIDRLLAQGNELTIVYDIAPFKENNFKSDFKGNNLKFLCNKYNFIKNGELSEEIKILIKENLKMGVSFIHCGGADILTYKLIE